MEINIGRAGHNHTRMSKHEVNITAICHVRSPSKILSRRQLSSSSRPFSGHWATTALNEEEEQEGKTRKKGAKG